jgi:hypothetical protein
LLVCMLRAFVELVLQGLLLWYLKNACKIIFG